MMRFASALACAFTLAATLPSVSLAEERTPRRFATVRAAGFTGYPDMFSGSGSVTAIRPLELEAGISVYSLGLINGGSYFVRGGFAFPISNSHHTELLALGGYRRQRDLYLNSPMRCSGRCERDGATLAVGLEQTGPAFGPLLLSLQVLAGVDYMVNRAGDTREEIQPDFRVSLGVGF